jgi:hypothetical protein
LAAAIAKDLGYKDFKTWKAFEGVFLTFEENYSKILMRYEGVTLLSTYAADLMVD